jgi:hypothetical protein
MAPVLLMADLLEAHNLMKSKPLGCPFFYRCRYEFRHNTEGTSISDRQHQKQRQERGWTVERVIVWTTAISEKEFKPDWRHSALFFKSLYTSGL